MTNKLLKFWRGESCDHDWEILTEHPHIAIYGFGELKCKKCFKTRTIWTELELTIFKAKRKNMTNKLPVVGQRYRKIGSDKIIHVTDINGMYAIFDSLELSSRATYLADFFIDYEEISTEKSFADETNKDAPSHPETSEKQGNFAKPLESKVDKAKELLKFEITRENRGFLKDAAQALLDALDEQEESMADEIDFTGYRPSRTAQEAVDEQLAFIKATEKPKSIWKDVSEFPRQDGIIIAKSFDGEKHLIKTIFVFNQLFGRQEWDWSLLNGQDTYKGDFKEYATLTDFISEHNQMKEDIEALKAKMEGK